MIVTIVVTFNGMKWCDKCFGSLLDSSMPTEIIVVDNASTDNTATFIKENYPEIHLIENKENLGFAKANNIGIKFALDHGADYVFLLNQDAWVEKDTIEKLIESFEANPDAGIVSPIHLNGTKSGLDFGFAGNMAYQNTPDFISDLYIGKLQKNYKTKFINAAAWLISRKCIEKVGGFDTSLFVHYGEDGNYCQRAQFHGFEILINTSCTICHDREFREDYEAIYRNSVWKTENALLERKSYLSNINLPIDIDELIIQNRRTIFKLKRKLVFSKIAGYRKDIEFLEQIKSSREINIKGGLNWL